MPFYAFFLSISVINKALFFFFLCVYFLCVVVCEFFFALQDGAATAVIAKKRKPKELVGWLSGGEQKLSTMEDMLVNVAGSAKAMRACCKEGREMVAVLLQVFFLFFFFMYSAFFLLSYLSAVEMAR